MRRFKRAIRRSLEGFLRFTHRYWFDAVSDQAQARELFACGRVTSAPTRSTQSQGRIPDMTDYLDTDSLRRQANTVVRLTVVTTFGLIGTVATGFLGMNLIAEADARMARKLWIFGVTFLIATVLTFYTMSSRSGCPTFSMRSPTSACRCGPRPRPCWPSGCTRANEPQRLSSHAPRARVPARSTRLAACSTRSPTITLGRPLLKSLQVLPELRVRQTPLSVAA